MLVCGEDLGFVPACLPPVMQVGHALVVCAHVRARVRACVCVYVCGWVGECVRVQGAVCGEDLGFVPACLPPDMQVGPWGRQERGVRACADVRAHVQGRRGFGPAQAPPPPTWRACTPA